MKQLRPLVSGLAAVSLFLGMIHTAAAQAQGTAKVVNIRGSARYMTSDNQSWRPLRVGALLGSGAVIQTAENSYVDLVLNDPNARSAGPTLTSAAAAGGAPMSAAASSSAQPAVKQDAVRIFENSVLGIDNLTVTQTGADRVTTTHLDLRHGRILGTVKKMSAASEYMVKIPNGVAGIRGTIYILSADGVLTVLSGSALLSWVGPDGAPITQEVRAGQQYDAKTGQLSVIPDALLREYIRIANEIMGLGVVPPTTFTVDRTVYFVSPTFAETDDGFFLEVGPAAVSATPLGG